MKILHVIHSVDPAGGGPIEGIKLTAAAMQSRGTTTDVMSLDAPDAPWVHDFPLPLFALGPGRTSYGYSPHAVPWLTKHGGDYDMVLVNGLWQFGSLAVWMAARRARFPYCVYTHGMLDTWFKRHYPLKHFKKWLYWPWGEYRVLRDAAAVLFTSEEERIEARKSFWLYQAKEKVVGYGIASPPGNGAEQKALFLERFPDLAGQRIILFLGRIHEKKGCDLALRAFHHLVSGAGAEKAAFHLVMAGPHENPYGLRMRQLTTELGLDDHVTWTGMLGGDLKWGALRAAEAFLLPSHQENFGVSVVEALACGVPVLISNKINIWREIEADCAGLVENDDLRGTIQLLQRWQKLSLEEQKLMQDQGAMSFANRYDVTAVSTWLLNELSIFQQKYRNGT